MLPLLSIEEAEEDSPSFRAHAARARQRVHSLRESSSRIVHHARAVLQAEQTVHESSLLLTDNLRLVFEDDQESPDGMFHVENVQVMSELTNAFSELNSCRDLLLVKTSALLIEPLAKSCQEDFTSVRAAGVAYDKSLHDYEQFVTKKAQEVPQPPRTLHDVDVEVALRRKRRLDSSGNFCAAVNSLVVEQQYAFPEKVLQYAMAMHAYFHQGYEAMQALQPALQSLSLRLQRHRDAVTAPELTANTPETPLYHQPVLHTSFSSASHGLEDRIMLRSYLFRREIQGADKTKAGSRIIWTRHYATVSRTGALRLISSHHLQMSSLPVTRVISLRDTQHIRQLPSQTDSSSARNRPHVFEVAFSSSAESILFQADTEHECDRWVFTLNKLLSLLCKTDTRADEAHETAVLAQADREREQRELHYLEWKRQELHLQQIKFAAQDTLYDSNPSTPPSLPLRDIKEATQAQLIRLKAIHQPSSRSDFSLSSSQYLSSLAMRPAPSPSTPDTDITASPATVSPAPQQRLVPSRPAPPPPANRPASSTAPGLSSRTASNAPRATAVTTANSVSFANREQQQQQRRLPFAPPLSPPPADTYAVPHTKTPPPHHRQQSAIIQPQQQYPPTQHKHKRALSATPVARLPPTHQEQQRLLDEATRRRVQDMRDREGPPKRPPPPSKAASARIRSFSDTNISAPTPPPSRVAAPVKQRSTEYAGRLTVEVISGSGLTQRDRTHYPDPYCIVSVGAQHRLKTRKIKRTINPHWNQLLSFDVTDTGASVVVSVYDSSGKLFSRDDLIGRATVPISSIVASGERVRASYELEPRNSDGGKNTVTLAIRFSKRMEVLSMDSFDVLVVLGQGSYGKVLQAIKKDTGQVYAIKVIKKSTIKPGTEALQRERDILMKVDHPFLMSLQFCFQSEAKLYFVMNYLGGGELYFHLHQSGKFEEERARFYASEILLAIEYLHSHGIVYRDLKAENVLLDMDGHVCLIDFGLSRDDMDEVAAAQTFCGSPDYVAPEVLLRKGYGRQVDWWSFGALMWEMLFGKPPFESSSVKDTFTRILKGPVRTLLENACGNYGDISEDAQMLLLGCLRRSPKERLGAARDGEELKAHPFFAPVDWKRLYLREIDPPYKPAMQSAFDTTNFSSHFTKRTPRESVVSTAIGSNVQEMFRNFSFQRDTDGTLTVDQDGTAVRIPAQVGDDDNDDEAFDFGSFDEEPV